MDIGLVNCWFFSFFPFRCSCY